MRRRRGGRRGSGGGPERRGRAGLVDLLVHVGCGGGLWKQGNGGLGEGAEEGGGGAAFFDEVGGDERFAEGGEGVVSKSLVAQTGNLDVGPAPGLDVLGRGPSGELGKVAAGAVSEGVDVEADLGEEVENVVVGGGEGLEFRKRHESRIRYLIGIIKGFVWIKVGKSSRRS